MSAQNSMFNNFQRTLCPIPSSRHLQVSVVFHIWKLLSPLKNLEGSSINSLLMVAPEAFYISRNISVGVEVHWVWLEWRRQYN
jgi:hypothetical protein